MEVHLTRHVKKRLEERLCRGQVDNMIELDGEMKCLGWRLGLKGLRKDYNLHIFNLGDFILTKEEDGWLALTYLLPFSKRNNSDYMNKTQAKNMFRNIQIEKVLF
jgi:hypothetical protein